jgi:hypothetical protein
MKILVGALAATLLAAPAFAQSGTTAPTPPAGADQGKPADNSAPADDATATPKPAGTEATPEPEQAPEGTTPVKPADTPSR